MFCNKHGLTLDVDVTQEYVEILFSELQFHYIPYNSTETGPTNGTIYQKNIVHKTFKKQTCENNLLYKFMNYVISLLTFLLLFNSVLSERTYELYATHLILIIIKTRC